MEVITIKVPASTANVGPGFDVLGIGLSLYLSLTLTIPSPDGKQGVTIVAEGLGKGSIATKPEDNLITRTALYVAKAHNTTLPPSIHVKCENEIPLGSGLGSSGAAVVAGVCLANEACKLGLTMDRMLDFCLFIEGHPDNVSPSLLGGFLAAYVNGADLEEAAVLQNGFAVSDKVPVPPAGGVGRYVRLKISPSIKAVAVTPDFEVPTHLARKALPPTYSRADVVFNLQRLAVLTSALGQETPDAQMVYEAMQDRVHQSYRSHLVPGLNQILTTLSPKSMPGLLGVCMSGAGPTVLALATDNFEEIGRAIQDIFSKHTGADGSSIQSNCRVLDIAHDGTIIQRGTR
ncbi:hypothetical protein HK102_003638 [Quaeritorhiza haematococci]|nr:hypothetical protein HK102_003638 [Quaeritorhiza haematococci]